jgi:hypothetical protein
MDDIKIFSDAYLKRVREQGVELHACLRILKELVLKCSLLEAKIKGLNKAQIETK